MNIVSERTAMRSSFKHVARVYMSWFEGAAIVSAADTEHVWRGDFLWSYRNGNTGELMFILDFVQRLACERLLVEEAAKVLREAKKLLDEPI